MGERTSYAPGTFCWVDLATPDPAGARRFYGALLDWEWEEIPLAEGVAYSLMRRDGGLVAGIHPGTGSGSTRPAWTSYVSVDDADDICRRAAGLGGSVLREPFDLAVSARAGAIRDPQGAVLGLWQPGEDIGATLVNDPGAFCLNQLNTTDPDGAAAFHTALFGWEITQVAEEPLPYWGIRNAGRLNGGMMGMPASQGPPHWLAFFTYGDDMHEAAGAVEALGGVVVAPVTHVPGGHILIARDPQGAYVGLFGGRVDP
jgi:uncharacterized protein